MNTFTDPDSMLMSPGSFPNQPNNQGANCNIAPMINRVAPSMMIHFAMSYRTRIAVERFLHRLPNTSLKDKDISIIADKPERLPVGRPSLIAS